MSHNILTNDLFVKRYLQFRGFGTTYKSFETELRNEKDRVYRVDKIMEQIQTAISGHDLIALRDLWTFLEVTCFSQLEETYLHHLRILENSLYKLYVVTCIQSNKNEKVKEFFEKLASDFQGDLEWSEWFALPFKKAPEESPTFACFFNKQWQDSLLVSLQNFLCVIVQSSPLPNFVQDDEAAKKIMKLEEENRKLREQLQEMQLQLQPASLLETGQVAGMSDSLISPGTPLPGTSAMDLLDDFHGLSGNVTQEITSTPQNNQGFRGLLKTFSSGRSNSPTQGSTLYSGQRDNTSVGVKVEEHRVSGTEDTAADAQRQGLPTKKEIKWNKSENLSKKTQRQFQLQEDTQHPHELLQNSHSSRLFDNSPTRKAVSSVTDVEIDNRPKYSESHSFVEPPPFVLLPQEYYKEHHTTVTHCRFSATGHTVASLDADGVVKVWNLQPSPVTMATVMSKSTLLSLEWASANGQLVLLGSKSGSVRLFDTAKKKIVGEAVVSKEFQRVTALCCDTAQSQFICSASGRSTNKQTNYRPGQLSLWDLETMRLKYIMPSSSIEVASSVNSLSWNVSAGNHNLVAGDEIGNIMQYDLRESPSTCKKQWKAHDGAVLTVVSKKDNCFSVGSDGKMKVWSLQNPGTIVQEVTLHEGACGPFISEGPGGYRQVHTPKDRVLAVAQNCAYALTCSANAGLIYQNSKFSWNKIQQLGGHISPVVTVDWSGSATAKQCLTASMNGMVCVFTLLNP